MEPAIWSRFFLFLFVYVFLARIASLLLSVLQVSATLAADASAIDFVFDKDTDQGGEGFADSDGFFDCSSFIDVSNDADLSNLLVNFLP